MSQWGLTDDANNSPIWSAVQLGKDNTRAEANLLFGNTTADAYAVNATIGSYGVSAIEAQASQGSKTAGWAIRTELTNGRVRWETLVATKNIASDASDDAVLPDYDIIFSLQPVNKTTTAGAAEATLFTITASSIPSTTLTYQWQQSVNGGASYSNINPAGGVFTGATSATLGINAGMSDTSSVFNGALFRCRVTAGDINETSSAGTLTVNP